MANPNHLMLLEDSLLWNEWRIRQPEIIPDLSGADLQDRNFRGIDFSQCNLIETNLSGANLIEANLSKASLRNANLKEANLTKAKLYQTILTEADLTKANLKEADLSKATLFGTNLTQANLSAAYLIGVKLRNANLTQANLTGVYLMDADLSGTNFSEANLTNADLSNVQATYANFTNSIFNGVCLEGFVADQTTILNNIFCTYLYLKSDQKKVLTSDVNKQIDLSILLNQLSQNANSVNINLDELKTRETSVYLSENITNQEIIKLKNKLQELKLLKTNIEEEINDIETKLNEHISLI